MAVSALLFGLTFTTAFNKEADWDTDTVKCMLCTSTYVPNQDTHKYKSDVTNEVSGTGYTAGGVTISPGTVTYTGATNKWDLDMADASWTGLVVTARIAVVYDATPGTDATRPLLGYVDFGADVTPGGLNFLIQWAAAGVAEITVS